MDKLLTKMVRQCLDKTMSVLHKAFSVIIITLVLGGVLAGGFYLGSTTKDIQAQEVPALSDKTPADGSSGTDPDRDYFDAEGNRFDYQGNLVQPAPQQEVVNESWNCR